jgi:hypothetical protein
MLVGLVLVGLGAASLWWAIARPRQFARGRDHDRAMPWMFSGEPYSWTRKAFATLPLTVDRGLHIGISILMVVGGIAFMTLR